MIPETLAAAIYCLTLNVYFEARGEPIIGQYAVAHVTINRAKEKQQSICKTVTDPYQFSWTIKGVAKVEGSSITLNPGWHPADLKAWAASQDVAKHAIRGFWNPIGPATFFHVVEIKRRWSEGLIQVGTIGRHVFYARPKDMVDTGFRETYQPIAYLMP